MLLRKKKKAKIQNFTSDQLKQRMSVYGNRCCYCGRDDIQMDVEHVIPLSKGGKHCLANLRPSCTTCNSKKGILNYQQWIDKMKKENITRNDIFISEFYL